MSRGRRLLIALLQLTAGVNVAARCRVHKQRVSEWAAGHRAPSYRVREVLETNYGIPRESWSQLYIPPRR